MDDNNAPDHPWWLQQAAARDLRLTWFVITGRVGTGANWGTWDAFKKLAAAGHEIASHTVTHFRAPGGASPDVAWEYEESKKQIAENLGAPPTAIAYPGSPAYKLNDPALAAKYYLAARGFTGRLNPANALNYFAVAASNTATLRDPSDPSSEIRQILEKTDGPGARFWRGWLVLYSHDVRKPGHRQKITALLDFIETRRGDLSLRPFSETALYARNRDASALSTAGQNTPGQIVLRLTRATDAAAFPAVPLTVKVRLPDGWETVAARQAAAPVPARLVRRDNLPFALVEITPGAGDVTLTP
ncbi:MAG: polysaccharide deacetylase family protein [Opitutaceae bacterium]|nr:polysaccharide deacetylase family protein [Opitutaceae bacterium]